jgi:hypothetical protein
MSNKDNSRQLATAWMRDRLIEEFRKRPEHSTHDVMVEVIIDRIYGEACNYETGNFHDVLRKQDSTYCKLGFEGSKVERKKFTVDNLKEKEIK